MRSFDERQEWELPHLQEVHQTVSYTGDYWDVKFYPYAEPSANPVFAVVGGKNTLICRFPTIESNAPEIIQVIIDEDPNANNFVCAWTKDSISGAPLLCIGGATAKIQVFDALTGRLCRTLVGHGGDIDDLAVSPLNPQILASSSDDATVRIWSLEPAHTKQPCAAILGGDGHQVTIYSVAFHATGRYLLSGGLDHIINLWTIPEFPDNNTGTNKTTRVYYPHFSSSEIHDNSVDCIAFHGDLILSKSATEGFIVLWSINGFSSTDPPPPPSSAPTAHDLKRDTRSSFAPPAAPDSPPGQYTRLMIFNFPDCDTNWARFSLYPGSPTTHPLLAITNQKSKIFFWDLARFGAYTDYLSELLAAEEEELLPSSELDPPATRNKPSQPKRPTFLQVFRHRNRKSIADYAKLSTAPSRRTSMDASSRTGDGSVHSSSDEDTRPNATNQRNERSSGKEKGKVNMKRSKENWAKKYNMGDPWVLVDPHAEEVVRKWTFLGRQIAWSAGGEWCVVAGSAGTIAVLGRNMGGR